jgi:hypothetical protein
MGRKSLLFCEQKRSKKTLIFVMWRGPCLTGRAGAGFSKFLQKAIAQKWQTSAILRILLGTLHVEH